MTLTGAYSFVEWRWKDYCQPPHDWHLCKTDKITNCEWFPHFERERERDKMSSL